MSFEPIPGMDGPGAEDKFLGLDGNLEALDQSRFVVLPVPFESTSSYQHGSKHGPKALIDASRYVEIFDIETGVEVCRQGIHTADPIDCRDYDKMCHSTYEKCLQYIRTDKMVAGLGGEHSISKPLISAHADHFGSLSVLQFDAHTDLRDKYEGDPHSHACVMARVRELPNIERIVAVGIRAMDRAEHEIANPSDIFYAHQIYGHLDWVDQVVERLTDKVYLSFDLDVFCPSLMPSTGTPEPGGLDWWSAMQLLKRVVEKRELVGFDVVELCPSDNKAPDFLAAKLVYTLFSYIHASKG